MNLRIILVITLLLFATVEPLVTYKPAVDNDFLVPENVRITNNISDGRYGDQVERLFTSFMRKWDIQGASLAISIDGKLVFAHGYGYADTAVRLKVEPYHRFRIASVSKLVTAVAIMKLCEEGRISIHDKVFGAEGILNDSIFSSPKDKRVYGITIAHLLSHQGGWTSRYGDHMFITQSVAKQLNADLPLKTTDYVRFALDKNLHFTPGTGRSYSNLGYAILGLVVERVSGMNYEEYCRKNIFEPIGVYDISLGRNLPDRRLPNEVIYYEHSASIPKLSVYGTGEIVPASYGGNDIESLGGAGAWIATAPDLIKFMQAIDGFDFNPDILSKSSIDQMTDATNGYAPLGWKAAFSNGVWWRTGFFPGTTTMMKRLPNGVEWVVLTNTSAWNGPELTNDINALMNRVFTQVKQWPDVDLLRFSVPVPLKQYVDSEPK